MKRISLYILMLLFLMIGVLFAQGQQKSEKYFNKATITVEEQNTSRKYFKFKTEVRPSVNEFISEYRSTFSLSDENDLRAARVKTDELGQTHYRYKQYYHGLEVFDIQFLVHVENGTVKSANGEIIHDLNVQTAPGLSEEQALEAALADIAAETYMWENPSEERMLKKVTDNKSSTYYPQGTLGIAAEKGLLKADKFKLVYRFDIYAAKPMSRHYVDVDAHTGKVINKISRIHTGTEAGSGNSLYNGNVKMKVANQDYPEAPTPIYFHVESGYWWVADPAIGGYDNSWYQVLDSDPINLTGSSPELTFWHRYAVETPSPFPPYDGWDGLNVRISTDGGTTWQVLANPVPAYTNASLYSFGDRHGEGPGIPGWAGTENSWTPVTVDLSAYAGNTVQIRFAFASDEAVATPDDPSWFGWQIDDILVSSSDGTLFSNDGDESGMTPRNLVTEVNIIAGDYRLRETIRGDGVFTYQLENTGFYSDAIDFVSSDKKDWSNPSFNETGVQVHWGTEQTYDYYKRKHNRDSFDDEGGRLISYARALFPYNNAFWNGQFMTYGDGDGTNFGPLVSLDVVGHELTHGVTERSAGLIYQGESGALNESFSDIFGNLIEFFVEGDDPAIWGVGEDFDLHNNGGFRSMSDPNSKGDPDTYYGNFWQGTTDIDFDNGGVHFNSGVQNYWFYLLAEGGSGTNDNGDDYDIEGIGLDKAAKIAYRNLTIYLTPYSAYYAARNGSIEAAIDLYGKNSKTVEAVKAAWDAVGVYENQPFINLANLKTFVQNLGLDAPDETLLVGLLDDAIGYLGAGDFANTEAALIDFQNAAIGLYFSGDISFAEVFYLLDETDKVFEMYSLNPSPHDNRPKPPIQTAVDIPLEFALEQNYPNPFNPVTTIKFSLPEASTVKLTIYNSTGQLVKNLIRENYQAGTYSVKWDGTNDTGAKVASGIYIYRFTAGNFVKTNKMILLK